MAINSTNANEISKLVVVDVENEFDVANILLELPYLMTDSLLNCRFPYDWGSKRRRTALVSPPPYSPPRSRRKINAASPPPYSGRKINAATPSKVEASSPNTPLSYSPSESDCKSNKLSNKKPPGLNSRKKQLEESVKDRMQTQRQLIESIEKVREYYNSQMAENLELKRRKQAVVMVTSTAIENQHQTPTTSAVAVNDQVYAVPSSSKVYHHQPPLSSHHQQNDQQNGGSNNQIHAHPQTLTEYHHQIPLITQYHQQQHYHHQQKPLIIYHHGQPSSTVNDSVYTVASIPSMLPHHLPLNPHQFVMSDNQRYVFDLSMQAYEVDRIAAAAAARQRRLSFQKGKRPRVGK
ncbi:hypothetical protein SOVF_138740 isoform A [Spinacia oleracea]|uniref:Uncharacterized protein n=1 Tax=Spinacia oleracea TaxID=3562 RepID=A0A9R0I436_SPIOL|nr:uncharacterized protein LOC110782432 [Spinacia oleracea]KNA11044.1 hypothetical protein SOVF_138740 isoform A [Spinacia oleracea]